MFSVVLFLTHIAFSTLYRVVKIGNYYSTFHTAFTKYFRSNFDERGYRALNNGTY